MTHDKNAMTLKDVLTGMNRKQRRAFVAYASKRAAHDAKVARHARRHGVEVTHHNNEPASLFDAQE